MNIFIVIPILIGILTIVFVSFEVVYYNLKKTYRRFANSDKSGVMSEENIQKLREISGHLVDPEIAVAIFEATPDALIVVNAAGTIQLVNLAAEVLFGYLRIQMYDQPIEMLIPERFRENHRKYRNEYMRLPASRPMGLRGAELFGLHRNGTEFPIEVSLSPIPTPTGLLVLAIARSRN